MFDRFTRDEISSWVWWPATMILVVLVVLTFPGENRAIAQRRDDAATRAWSLATGTIAPALADAAASPIGGETNAELTALVREGALGAPWADVVRIWSADSTLLWSSDPADPVGSAGGLNDEEIDRANADVTRALQVVSERDLDGRPADATFSAYAPFTLGGEVATAQFEVADATLLGDVRGDWLGYRIVFGLAAALTLALAAGSMREPVARIGAGVPFYRTSVPRGMDVIELDRKLELERSGANARERVAHMDARLRESEELRLKAEGDLQRALSQLATQPGRPTRSVIPRPTADQPGAAPIAPAPIAPAPIAPAPAAPPPGAVPPVTPPPPVVEPPAASSPLERRPAAVRATPVAADDARDGLTLVPPLEERSRTAAPPSDPEPRPSHPSRRPAPAGGAPPTERAEPDPLVIVPEAASVPVDPPVAVSRRQPDIVLPPSDPIDTTDPEAREVLERLVEPVAVSVTPADDPSVLRAKLARTAARKKPGSRHDERLRDDEAT